METSESRPAKGTGPRYRTRTKTFQVSEDIMPISELKANLSEVVRGLEQRPRPLVITLDGKPAAVVMSPREYDSLSYQHRFMTAVHEGLADGEAGRVIDDDELRRRVKARHGSKTARK